MRELFYICFITGIVYTIISVVIGGIFDIFNFGIGIDLGVEFPFASLLKPVVIVTFLTVFGGMGLIGLNKGWKYGIIIALILAFIMAFIMWRGVLVNLIKAENTSSVKRCELIGVKAIVIETIQEEGMGAIAYSINGNKYSSPAKSVEGHRILKEQEVIITRIDKNVFYVIPLMEIHKK